MSYHMHTGVWVDWSRGRVLGATLTLSSRDASLLLAFVATFVTVVAVRLWHIVTYAAHQILAAKGEHDGLYYQRQHILRNSQSAANAAWSFLLQAWYWRGVAPRAMVRTVPWAVLALLYTASSAVLAVFSSQISGSASGFQLVARNPRCGFHEPADTMAFQEKVSYDNLHASIYSRQCYRNSSTASSSFTCRSLPKPSIQWLNSSAECPFASRVCLDTPAFRMQSEVIDSHIHLGINDKVENRISYQRETVCAPLVTQPGFAEYVTGQEAESLGWNDDVFLKYLYGPVAGQNYTQLYNTLAATTLSGYTTWSYYHDAGANQPIWEPVPALTVEDRDVTIIFIAANSVLHLEPNDDPVFAANIATQTGARIAYGPDRFVSPIACTDGHRICSPSTGACTTLQGRLEVSTRALDARIGLNSAQTATVERLGRDIMGTSFYDLTWTRAQSFLRAQEQTGTLIGAPLPDNQWEIEMASLFDDAMARLQHQALQYATGPEAPGTTELIRPWEDGGSSVDSSADRKVLDAQSAMCEKQRVRARPDHLNFSVVGLAVLLALGGLIIVVSLIVEPVTARIQDITGWGAHKAIMWQLDDGLQVMRMLFELRGAGVWQGPIGTFPRTVSGDRFLPWRAD